MNLKILNTYICFALGASVGGHILRFLSPLRLLCARCLSEPVLQKRKRKPIKTLPLCKFIQILKIALLYLNVYADKYPSSMS